MPLLRLIVTTTMMLTQHHHDAMSGADDPQLRLTSAERRAAAAAVALSHPVILAIAIGGSAALFSVAAVLFIHLARCRRVHQARVRRALDEEEEEETEIDVSEVGTKKGRRVLRKERPRHLRANSTQEPHGGVLAEEEDLESELDSEADGRKRFSFKRISLPVLPPLFTRRRSEFDPFGGPFGSASSANSNSSKAAILDRPRAQRRTSNSWVDEDALHGPKMGKKTPGKKERKSIRESWPLRSMVPTLPRLQLAAHMQSSEQGREVQRGLMIASDASISPESARNLPRPPRPVLLAPGYRLVPAQRSPSSGVGISPPRKGVGYVPGSGRRVSRRQGSADSTLSEILRSTEKRLQEGTAATGVARRNKARVDAGMGLRTPMMREAGMLMGSLEGVEYSSSFHTEVSPGEPVSPVDGEEMFELEGMRDGVVSPTSDPGDIYEIYASTGDEEDGFTITPSSEATTDNHSPTNATALTSPSRTSNRPREPPGRAGLSQSPSSSVSSALSTVYSEDERSETNATSMTAAQSVSVASGNGSSAFMQSLIAANRIAYAQNGGVDPVFDPFVGANGGRNAPAPMQARESVNWRLHTPPGGLKRPPKLRNSNAQEYGVVDSRGGDMAPPAYRAPSFSPGDDIDVDATPKASSSGARTVGRSSVASRTTPTWTNKPSLLVTSPSTVSGSAVNSPQSIPALTLATIAVDEEDTSNQVTPTRTRKIFPLPAQHQLHPVRSSPTLGRRRGGAEGAYTSPPPAIPVTPGLDPEALTVHRRAASYTSLVSASSAEADQDGEDSPILRRMPGPTHPTAEDGDGPGSGGDGAGRLRAASTTSSDYSYTSTCYTASIAPTTISTVALPRTAMPPPESPTRSGKGIVPPRPLPPAPIPAPLSIRRGASTASNISTATAGIGGVGATAAALRRMNSTMSCQSGVSTVGPAATSENDPLARLKSARAGNRNYLALGRGNRMRERGGERGEKVVSVVFEEEGREKENEEGGGDEEEGDDDLELPKGVFNVPEVRIVDSPARSGVGVVLGTPGRRSRTALEERGSPERGNGELFRNSEDNVSLGLYDPDGFLISSPLRA